MSSSRDIAQVTATPVQGCLVVTLPADLSTRVFEALRERTLDGLRQGGCHAVVFELSAVQIMDREDFERLRQLAATTRLLGARPLLVGFGAGVVMHLVESDVDTTDLEVARDLEEALARARAETEDEGGDGDSDQDERSDPPGIHEFPPADDAQEAA